MPPRPKQIQKPKDMKQALRRLIAFCRRYIPAMIVALVLAAAGAVLTILGPNRIGEITNYIKDGLMTGIDMDGIARVSLILGVIYLSSALCMFAQHFIMATVTQHLSRRMRSEISAKIHHLPLKYFSTHAYGDVLSRMTNDVDTIGQSFANSLASIVSAAAQFVGCLIMMFVTNAVLALTSIAATIAGMFLMLAIMKHSQRYFIQRQRALGELNGYIEEMYNGHDVIRTSNAADSVKARFAHLNDAVRDSNFHSQFLSGLMQPLMNFMGNLGYVAVCVVGALLTMNGRIEFGVITAFMIYVRQFESPLRQIAQGMTNMQSAAAAAERVFDFLREEELPDEREKTAALPAVRGAVDFEDVHFAYPDQPEREIIHGFTAHIQAGQKVAIVGPTGAGKTTLVNLLMRFYETTGGRICVDGIPIDALSRTQVHSLFGMVLQDTWLFEGTVRENLVFNLEDVDEARLDEVCAACGLSHFVQTLPKKYDTVLTDASEISVGQKQLLTIARAMLQNSPMLILDEATSSIDTRTEVLVQQAMDRLTEGRTSFVIAHRLSTIRNADLILAVRDGDIVEQGSHDELIARGGFYSELYHSQFDRAG